MPSDKVHRILLINALSGAVLGLLVTALIIALDVGGLRGLVLRDQGGLVPVLLLAGGFIVTCSSLLMGSAIMTMRGDDRDDDDRSGGGGGRHEWQPAPVRVRARR
jgi:hypothetical protein